MRRVGCDHSGLQRATSDSTKLFTFLKSHISKELSARVENTDRRGGLSAENPPGVDSELCSCVCVLTDDSIDADALKISARAAEGVLQGSSADAEDFWQSPEATAPCLGRFRPALLNRHVKKNQSGSLSDPHTPNMLRLLCKQNAFSIFC